MGVGTRCSEYNEQTLTAPWQTFPVENLDSNNIICQIFHCEREKWFYNYLKFLPIFFWETFTVFKLSYLHWRSQMSAGFACSDFLKLKPKFLNNSKERKILRNKYE